MERYAALGPDFLTWMLVRSGEEGALTTPSEPGLQVALMGPMVFTSATGEATKVTLAGDEAPASPEVRAALRQGKRVARTKIEFTAVDAKWIFTLEGETFDIKSAKLPVPKMPDQDEYMTMRVQAAQHLVAIVHELFETFLSARLDPAKWAEEITSWREFAEAG